jgi:rod shape determining protein RodA
VARLRFRGIGAPDLTLGERAWRLRWDMLVILTAVAAIGVAMLYSAANADLEPWAWRHATRYAACLALLLAVALVDVRLLLRFAYPLYLAVLGLLAAVELKGVVGMGAQRWISLGIIQLQPSELMKIAVVLALARYFHGLGAEEVGRLRHLLVPTALIAAPVAMVLRQPDLGTAVLVAAAGAAVLVAAGIHWSALLAGAAAGLASVPIGWQFLHDYQRRRILIFLDPEADPLGAGYHAMQSKIALGSGGMFGKGFLQGTQSHLNFVPEKQTDFVFAMLAEEFGLAGAAVLLGLYVVLLIYGYAIALACRHQFGRLLAIGVTATLFLYVFVNVAMVTGLVPVVGVPLPLISYGGTAMLTVMLGFGLLMNVFVNRDARIGRHGENLDR